MAKTPPTGGDLAARSAPRPGHNQPPVTITLDAEMAAFVVDNCEANTRVNMMTLQMVHDNQLELSEDKCRALITFTEKFRQLKSLIEAASKK